MKIEQNHLKGLVLASVGVLVLTPDTLLIRLIDTDQWTLVFWRGVLMGGALLLGAAVVDGRQFFSTIRRLGWTGLGIALANGTSSILFVVSLSHTSVANTLVIIAASPMFAAVFAWLILKERVPLRTVIAIVATLSGIALVFGQGLGRGAWMGDLAALGTGAAMAVMFVLIRLKKDINMVPATGCGILVAGLAPLFLGLASPLSIPADDIIWLLLMGLVVLPVSFAMITVAPRYLPAPEVGLMLLLETVLGPLWVWLVLGEEVGVMALIGGFIVVSTLATHSFIALRRMRR